jgi:hypothetical protein
MTAPQVTKAAVLVTLVLLALLVTQAASAHCDALDGPVVADARTALEQRDPAAVLKWVRPADAAQIREAFARTLAVRGKGRDARELADRWFFETLVRVHRAGEGEPFTGLKPAGHVDPGLAAADAALRGGDVQALAHELGEAIAAGVARRHALAAGRRAHLADGVDAGRAYVEAYVDYAHYVEAVHALATQGAGHGHAEPRQAESRAGH